MAMVSSVLPPDQALRVSTPDSTPCSMLRFWQLPHALHKLRPMMHVLCLFYSMLSANPAWHMQLNCSTQSSLAPAIPMPAAHRSLQVPPHKAVSQMLASSPSEPPMSPCVAS